MCKRVEILLTKMPPPPLYTEITYCLLSRSTLYKPLNRDEIVTEINNKSLNLETVFQVYFFPHTPYIWGRLCISEIDRINLAPLLAGTVSSRYTEILLIGGLAFS